MLKQWSLIYDPPMPGKANMDRDLEILSSVAAGNSPPTLRLYRWAPPALSLGRFQKLEQVADLEACRRLGIDVVRRPTGGRAVLHHRELTYSIIVPDSRSLIPEGILPAYRFLNRALLAAFNMLEIETEQAPEKMRGPRLAPGSCFDSSSAYELRVAVKKWWAVLVAPGWCAAAARFNPAGAAPGYLPAGLRPGTGKIGPIISSLWAARRRVFRTWL